ncbi:hypothetical protein KR067_009305 [Drosophila pandora]|nr:hypothetical protein KR067_009305 [Drosophila pandora]
MKKQTRAAKKKLKKLLNQGFSLEEAREQLYQCNNPNSQIPRSHPKNLWPTERVIKLAIIPVGFPQVLLTTQQLEDIETAILQSIVVQRNGRVKPLFGGSKFYPGWMTVTCRNIITAQWLEEDVATLKVEPDIDLLTVPASAIPQKEVFVGYFPISQCGDSPDVILALLAGQNEGLRVSDWRIYNRKPKGPTGLLMAIALDPQSAAQVRRMDYRLSFSFGEITLHPSRRSSAKNKWKKFFEIVNGEGQQEPEELFEEDWQIEEDNTYTYHPDTGFENYSDDLFSFEFENFSMSVQTFKQFDYSNTESERWNQDQGIQSSTPLKTQREWEPDWNFH